MIEYWVLLGESMTDSGSSRSDTSPDSPARRHVVHADAHQALQIDKRPGIVAMGCGRTMLAE